MIKDLIEAAERDIIVTIAVLLVLWYVWQKISAGNPLKGLTDWLNQLWQDLTQLQGWPGNAADVSPPTFDANGDPTGAATSGGAIGGGGGDAF